MRGHWVYWGAPCVPSGLSGVTEFTGVLPVGRRVHPRSLGLQWCTLEAAEFIWGRLVR